MSVDGDDFYMILPSNGCKDTHPDNEANTYTISWEQPILLDERWKVALTEANFSYTMTSINTNFGIRYEKFITARKQYRGRLIGNNTKRHAEVEFPQLPDDSPADPTGLQPFIVPQIKYYEFMYDLVMESTSPFRIHILGLNLEYSTNTDAAPYTLMMNTKEFGIEDQPITDLVYNLEVVLEYTSLPYKITEEIYSQQDVFWHDTDEMVGGLLTIFGTVFRKLEVLEGGKLSILCQEGMASLDFLNGLNIVLGFQRRKYSVDSGYRGTPLHAESVPYLRHGINNIYVYSSICRPIRVGEVCVPLLKSIWLDTSTMRQSNVFGEMRNVVVKNPMYIPLSSTSINSIEVNIRSDSGHLLPFVAGSITSLTLHFKRQ